ncbi:MAG: hypothetical protein JST43_02065 [Bacteroidetes bacterium]|nr:hypothetical protein [Bacteroidota bacterium]MBS1540011.1 hypothetical protein [Bacteroidota bacterium]
MTTKESFHQLIDLIEDEQKLKSYFDLIEKLNSQKPGELWGSLSQEQKNELLLSYDESFNEKNWVSHQEAKRQHAQWLTK